MGTAIAVRADFSSQELRRLATRVKDAAQARRLLAIAAVLDGAAREEAAKIGGMDRQTLRDWVIRFNDQGPDGLINKSSPGAPGKLSKEHKAFLARLVEEGPIPAVDGVVRWRVCDLIPTASESNRCRCPGSCCDGLDTTGLSCECIPSIAASVDDCIVVVEDPVAELVLAQILPDVLDRIEFG